MLNSSNKSSATAGILTNFLPVLDKLMALRQQYEQDEFGQQYNALSGDMRGVFSKMDVTEYGVQVGEPVDTRKVTVVAAEHSTEVAADAVLRPVSMGMELQGNVIRMAECGASLGPEVVEEEAAAAAAEETPEEPADEA